MSTIKPAGFWRRFAALLIDCLILALPFWAVTWTLGMTTRMFMVSSASFFIVQILSFALAAIYPVFFLASRWQATPGKRIMKVYVVQAEEGGRINLRRSLGRYLVLNAASILYMVLATLLVPVPTLPAEMSAADQQQFEIIKQKMERQEQLTPEERQRMETIMQNVMQNTISRMGVSADQLQQLKAIEQKQQAHEPLTPEEQQLSDEVSHKISSTAMKGAGIGFFAVLYALAIAIMVGVTRRKTGLHDLVCKTRVLCGTPDAPIMEA